MKLRLNEQQNDDDEHSVDPDFPYDIIVFLRAISPSHEKNRTLILLSIRTI